LLDASGDVFVFGGTFNFGDMREIKFRGLGKNDIWRYGYYFAHVGVTESYHYIRENSSDHRIDALTLGQYTGLKDKSGKEIYEGDIVRFIDTEFTSNESGSSYDDLPMLEHIIWNEDESGWDVSSRNYIDRQDFLDQTGDDVEVIGNIYQNPDLLKS
jgi:uncharacterized phage protein (TIGR01671 family)